MKLSPRVYLQFSLRTAFAVLTAGCIWLGFTVEQARKQREATAKIRAFGGGVSYDWQRRWFEAHGVAVHPRQSNDWRPPAPAWLRRLIGDDFFQ